MYQVDHYTKYARDGFHKYVTHGKLDSKMLLKGPTPFSYFLSYEEEEENNNIVSLTEL